MSIPRTIHGLNAMDCLSAMQKCIRRGLERDALEFVRHQFPSHEPYRAWSNFEFIADDGSVNEVDLLVFTPQGFFLIEIKSGRGRLFGDASTWTWQTPMAS